METRCPACYSDSVLELWSTSTEEAAQHFVRKQGDSERYKMLVIHLRNLWRNDNCRLVRCMNCGLSYSVPFVAGDATFYNLAYPAIDYPKNRWEYRKTLDVINKANLAEKKCLEIGAGFGYFLDKLEAMGLDSSNITALEFNTDAILTLRKKNYNVLSVDLRDITESSVYDYIFMFQVLEHMDALDNVFSILSRILSLKGTIFIAVPNYHRINFNEANHSLPDMPPNHISRWPISAFEALLQRHSFRVHYYAAEPFSFKEFCIQDLGYYFLRQSQNSGTLASHAYSLQRSALRRVLMLTVVLLYLPRRLSVWLKAISNRKILGGSLWVQVRR